MSINESTRMERYFESLQKCDLSALKKRKYVRDKDERRECKRKFKERQRQLQPKKKQKKGGFIHPPLPDILSLPLVIEHHRFNNLRKMTYPQYLRTYEWRLIRKIALTLKPTCEVCKTKKGRQVHHKRYPYRGTEIIQDLMIVCIKCHQSFHPEKAEEGKLTIYKMVK